MANIRSNSILLKDDDLGVAQELARTMGADFQILPKPQIVEPFTAILITGGIVLTIKLVVDLVDRARGGVVVDLRSDAPYLVRRDRAVPSGWVMVVAPDGKSIKIETRDAPKDTAERLLSEIIGGTLHTSREIGKAATDALGASKVEESPAASV